jgi:putative DNA-invertase from lambdoid prophage Rac
MAGFRSGEYDTVVVAKLDRFARSLQELVADVRYIVDNGGRFVAISNGMDFTKKQFNASQQLMLNIFASFAEFEREIIRERTIEGLARVRAQGKTLGRPRKTPPANPPSVLKGGDDK